jgi:hypothetical protein
MYDIHKDLRQVSDATRLLVVGRTDGISAKIPFALAVTPPDSYHSVMKNLSNFW